MTTNETPSQSASGAGEPQATRAQRRPARTSAGGRPAPRKGRVAVARDRIVLTSMGIVTAAVSAMLYTQFAFSAPSSILAGAAAWTIFMMIHQQVQKSYEIDHLRHEVHRLEGHLRGGGNTSEWPTADAVQSREDLGALPIAAVESEPNKDVSDERVAALTDAILSVADEEAAAEARAAHPAIAGSVADGVALDASEAPELPSKPRWESAPPMSGLFGKLRDVPPIPANAPHASDAAPDADPLPPSVGATLPPSPAPQPMDTTLWPGTSLSAADPMREHWAFRPRTEIRDETQSAATRSPAVAAPVATVETDLALVQSRIKALAEEVNATEALRAAAKAAAPAASRAPPPPADQSPASALDASIGALRTLAVGMKTPRYVEPPSLGAARPDSGVSDRLAAAIAESSEPAGAPVAAPALGFGDLKIPSSAEPIAVSEPPARSLPQLPELPFPVLRGDSGPAFAPPTPPLPPGPTLSMPPPFAIYADARDAGPSFAGPVFDQPAPGAELEFGSAFDFDLSGLPKLTLPAAPEPSPHVRAIAEAIEAGRMDVFLSPIVTLADHAVTHYEVSMRLKSAEGEELGCDEEEVALAGDEIVAMFDIGRLNRAAQLAAMMVARGKTGALMSEVAGRSLTNPGFRATVEGVRAERPAISSQLVLTLSQAAVESFTASAWQALSELRIFGFRFALDRIAHIDTDFAALARAGFTFAKIEARVLLDGLSHGTQTMSAHEVCRTIAGAGLGIVASGIADDKMSAEIFGFGVLLGQGQMFGTRLVNLPPKAAKDRSAAA